MKPQTFQLKKDFRAPKRLYASTQVSLISDHPVSFSNALLSFKMSTAFLFLYK